ncbi:hypothetical protein JR316_0001207 [Psilocybe cubensis]|uniref:Uncharacterized protein n=2 Tax=Psilocybe cubensis TaxID=181762 RepID=A0A8H8CRW4_PSICU|nr:hypothetical protein JR316_0001207 [Psilocybe cubensis]KAH9487138.1 hypothetical protein JR316_0001207 [Psilocybe cubensis]
MPSYTRAAVLILFASYHLTIAAPVPDNSNQVNNAYTGTAGDASGGSVLSESNAPKSIFNGGNLLKLFSGNGGNGKSANSGTASAILPSSLQVGGSNTDGSSSGGTNANSVGNTYSGAGGIAKGGDTVASGGLLELFSDNAGSGGSASSGSAGSPVITTTTSTRKLGKSRIIRVVRMRSK